MSIECERAPAPEGLRFFGTVVAAQCHEVINVLNILNEVAGLIEDLAGAAVLDAGRVQALSQKIQAQIQRGQGLVRSISRFAHSADQSSAVVDVADLVRAALDLLERPVRLAGSTLKAELPATPVVVEACPFGLLQAVFSAVEVWLSPVPTQIALSLRSEGTGLRFTVERADAAVDVGAAQLQRLAFLHDQVSALGGQILEAPPASGLRIAFVLPARVLPLPQEPGTR